KVVQESARLVANHEVHNDTLSGGWKLGRRALGRCGVVPQVWATNLGDQESGACQQNGHENPHDQDGQVLRL
ncbi:MAG TPA: hypothetical protein VI669_07795, partial [Vicinamibacteria bacterium]